MTTALQREDTTTNEYRQAAVRWARRALQPGAAVILGIETTTPGAGAFVEIAVIETDTTTIRMNTLVKPWAPINPRTQLRHHLTDSMVAGAPTFSQILTDLITITDRRVILAYNSGPAFDTVIREAQRARLDPEHLADRGNWLSIAQARSGWLGHPDHYLPISPTPRALGQCHAALSVLRDIAAD
jgi:DNA polymerase III epsilon subunit-like protein